jgi:hypothetical protein
MTLYIQSKMMQTANSLLAELECINLNEHFLRLLQESVFGYENVNH